MQCYCSSIILHVFHFLCRTSCTFWIRSSCRFFRDWDEAGVLNPYLFLAHHRSRNQNFSRRSNLGAYYIELAIILLLLARLFHWWLDWMCMETRTYPCCTLNWRWKEGSGIGKQSINFLSYLTYLPLYIISFITYSLLGVTLKYKVLHVLCMCMCT